MLSSYHVLGEAGQDLPPLCQIVLRPVRSALAHRPSVWPPTAWGLDRQRGQGAARASQTPRYARRQKGSTDPGCGFVWVSRGASVGGTAASASIVAGIMV
jgi:hypothetical protein